MSAKGFDVAEEKRTLTKTSDNVYKATLEAETVGFASLFKDYTIFGQSNFIVNDKGVDTKYYTRVERDSGDIKKDFFVIADSKKQLAKGKNNKEWKTKKGNIVDILSIFYAMVYDLEHYPERIHFYYQTITGEIIEPDHYKKVAIETITIKDVDYKAVRLEKQDDPNTIRQTKGWFAIDKNYLLLKVEHTSAEDDIFRYTINFDRNK